MTDAPQEPTRAPSNYSSATPPPPVTSESYPPAPPLPPAQAPTAAKSDSPKRSATVGIIAALAVGALIGGVTGAGVSLWAVNTNSSGTSTASALPAEITVNNPSDATTVTAVAAKASPSVVTISVSGQSASGTGSGVILTDDGYILTNTHVVTLDGAAAGATIRVQTSDGRLLDATLVGTDPIVDLAVIKVDDSADLTPMEFADSSKLNVGDVTVAIGAPLGLANTVTDGIVSALNRSITVASSAAPESSGDDTAPANPDAPSPFDFWNFGQDSGSAAAPSSATISLPVVQTDASINPGNSGGALLDDEGKLIGINVAIASAGGSSTSGSIGVGFAIPSNLAKRIGDELMAGGTASHGLLGANVEDVTEATQPDATTVGASIKAVVADGAAAAGGIKAGDIITQFNGIPITNPTDLTAQVRVLAGGANAEVTYIRGGKSATTTVTLGTLEQ
ncbi:MAG: hypothetical protein JWQ43_2679 [Glaciihabitans sp.]|nr:hypothetical protein [Glaciihabitans sp.]